MDLERALLYRGKVHHLFVLAYNRDLEMFRSLADSLSRTVYCNVVVCNTGFYGGSVAVSPFDKPWKRTIYEHNGGGLFSTQVVRLPVLGIDKALRLNDRGGSANNPEFKHPPPGCEKAKITIDRLQQRSFKTL
jgi:hypothetical protein